MTHPRWLRNVRPYGSTAEDLLIENGRFTQRRPASTTGLLATDIDGKNQLLTPALVESHVHLDKTLWGQPWRPNSAGPTLKDYIANERRILREVDAPIAHRAGALLENCIARGSLTMRCHVDIDPEFGLRHVEAMQQLREKYRDLVDLQLGRVWTPYDDTRALINDTFNANFASSFNVWRGYTDRTTNGIRYNTPSFGGLSAAVVYSFGEDKTATTGASSLTAFSLNYANGPIAAGLAHQIQQDKSATASTVSDTSGTPFGGAALSSLLNGAAQTVSKTTYTLINGSYDFGVAKVLAGYNTAKATSTAVAGNAKANEWNIGAEVPFGSALALGVGYAESQVKVNGVDRNETTGYSAALKYSLSKRTFVYGGLTKAEEETAAGVSVEKTTRYFVGVSHAF